MMTYNRQRLQFFTVLLLILYLVIQPFSLFSETNSELSVKLNEQGVLKVQEKEFESAESYFIDSLEADPRNLTAVFNLAGMYLTNQKADKALKLLKPYVEKNTEDVGLQIRLGDAYFSSRKIPEAKEAYLKAYQLQVDYPALAGKLGTIYGMENNLVEAEEMFLQAVKQSPENYDYILSYSNILLANQNIEDAIRYAKKALQLKASPEAYITLGSAYERSNKPENALISFKRARDLGSQDKALTEKIKQLEK